jgi:hypothetical protein
MWKLLPSLLPMILGSNLLPMPFHWRHPSFASNPVTTPPRAVRDSKIVARDKAATAADAISEGAAGAAATIAVVVEDEEESADSAATFRRRNMLHHGLLKRLPVSLLPRKGTSRLFCPGSPWQSIATSLRGLRQPAFRLKITR